MAKVKLDFYNYLFIRFLISIFYLFSYVIVKKMLSFQVAYSIVQ